MRRIVVVAASAEDAEAARSLLQQGGQHVDAVVIEGDWDASDRASAQVGPVEEAIEPDPHHLERLATLGTLAAGTAHEVNNLLTHLLATLYDAQRTLMWLDPNQSADEAPRARLRRDLEGALDSCTQLRALARGITQYSSLGGSGTIETDLEALLDEALQIAGPELKLRAHIARKGAADTPRVCVNPPKICQVFVNLLTNAAHAIAARGAGVGVIRIATMREGEFARIDVADTGCGVAPDVASRIFEPFFTTKSEPAGTGLGLAVSRTIVEEHGGELGFSSEVGAGTTFSVYLPRCRDADN